MRTERQREQEQTDSQPDDSRGQQSGGGLYGFEFFAALRTGHRV
jgi:hypothetical protein